MVFPPLIVVADMLLALDGPPEAVPDGLLPEGPGPGGPCSPTSNTSNAFLPPP